MCGIVGFIGGTLEQHESKRVIGLMGDAIFHRGPDSYGDWLDSNVKIALGHRRLAIVDISSAGAQPMKSKSGRYILIFNGEIYNHKYLRGLLERKFDYRNWIGHSDTETLLACIEYFGIESTLKQCIGMFAISLWDKKEKILTLARDRAGEKPLYYGWIGVGYSKAFVFSSEIKAIKKYPGFKGDINRDALNGYVRHNCVVGKDSIYTGFSKVLPGELISVNSSGDILNSHRYWSIEDVILNGKNNKFKGTHYDAVEELDKVLTNAIGNQMLADVPLGAFLSGGIDSTTIVALMQKQSTRPIKTFTIGFNEKSFDEAIYAKDVASYLGTQHKELYLSANDAMSIIPNLADIYCEPFADSSQIPTFLVSKLAKTEVTVSLSGDAGDEIFCGYNRYKYTNNLWRYIENLPLGIRRGVLSFLKLKSTNSALSRVGLNRFNEIINKSAGIIDARDINELYRRIISHTDSPCDFVLNSKDVYKSMNNENLEINNISSIEKMMLRDFGGYLVDDILVKVDRAAMANSLETRVPFLDHNVIEFAWTLPIDWKIRDGETKWPLKNVLYKYVPKKLVDRPKMGFGVPFGEWLRGPLRGWVEEMLNNDNIAEQGYFDPIRVKKMWNDHLTGVSDNKYMLWNILMFQSWLYKSKLD